MERVEDTSGSFASVAQSSAAEEDSDSEEHCNGAAEDTRGSFASAQCSAAEEDSGSEAAASGSFASVEQSSAGFSKDAVACSS